MPIGSAIKAGHRVSLPADWPMFPPGPFKLMRTAITRTSRNGDILNSSEGISPEQALRAIAIDAAWQLFMDGRVGSIEPGKLADFTVVDRNPPPVPPSDLHDLIVRAGATRANSSLGSQKVPPHSSSPHSPRNPKVITG